MGAMMNGGGVRKARAAGLAIAVAIGGFAMAAPTSAEAVICAAAKVRPNGVIVRGTRTFGERLTAPRACRVALRRCRRQFGRLPGRCEVVARRPRVR